MGEIFHALEVLNRTMNLGLSAKQLLGAEMGFKSAFAEVSNPNPVARQLAGDPVALAESFELVATLRPRAQKLTLNQLSTFAGQAAQAPKMRVSAQTMQTITQQLNAPAATSGLSSVSSQLRSGLPGQNLNAPNLGSNFGKR